MNIKFEFSPKIIIRSIAGGISAALLSIAFTYMIIAFFNWPTQLIYPIGFTFVIILAVVFNMKPKAIYVITGLFILFIGGLLIFLSGRKDIVEQITWSPGLLGAGASIGALGITFLNTLTPQRTQNAEQGQTPTPQNQTTAETAKTIKYAFALVAILGIATLVKDFLEKKPSKKD